MSQPTASQGEQPPRPRHVPWRPALIALFALASLYVIGLLVAPYIRVGRFEAPLRSAIERSLGRSIELHDVRLSLYPSPGLSASDLVIHDAPGYGLEPLAYVGQMQVGLRWGALLTGRLECASVRLVDASLNVARGQDSSWNILTFLARTTGSIGTGGRAPTLQLRNSRVNFRDGLRKSPFFLNAVDFDLDSATSPERGFAWQYEASPARTDRSEQGFGRLSGSGRWRSSSEQSDGLLDLEMDLERSVISEVGTLITGSDPGIQGRLSSRANISGPLDKLQIRGTLKLGDLEKASLFGVHGKDWAVPYEGVLNLRGQSVEIGTVVPAGASTSKEGAGLPLSVHFSAGGLFAKTVWQTRFSFDGFPASAMLEAVGWMGVQVPPAVSAGGSLFGALDFDSTARPHGSVEWREGKLDLGKAGGETSQYLFETSILSVQDGRLALDSAAVSTPAGSSGKLSAEWNLSNGALTLAAAIKRGGVKELLTAAGAFPSLDLPAGIAACQDGAFDGQLKFEHDAEPESAEPATESPARWSGALHLNGLSCALDGAADPVVIEKGQLTIAGPSWQLKRANGQIGTVPWSGEAAWQPAVAPAVKFTLNLGAVPAGEFERLLRPSLGYRPGLLGRTLTFRAAPPPEWLANRRWDGRITAPSVVLNGFTFARASAHLLWNGTSVDLADLEAGVAGGRLAGRGFIQLGASEPLYRVLAVLSSIDCEGRGNADGEFSLTASGFGDDLLDSLRASGDLSARKLEVPGAVLDQFSFGFDYDAGRAARRLRLNEIQAASPDAAWLGAGGSTAERRWSAELTSATRTLRLSGTYPPFHFEIEPGPAAHTR